MDNVDLSEFRLQLAGMGASMVDIRSSVFQIAEAITRLAVLEEKHQTTVTTINKVVERIEIIEGRQHAQALAMAEVRGQAEGASRVVKILWAILGTGAVAMLMAGFKLLVPLLH